MIIINPKSWCQQNGWIRGCSPWQGWSWWGTHRMIFDRPCSCPRSWNIDCKNFLWMWKSSLNLNISMMSCSETGSGRWVIMCLRNQLVQNPNVFENSSFTIRSYFAQVCFQIKIQIIRMHIVLKICKGEELFIDLVLLGTESHLKKVVNWAKNYLVWRDEIVNDIDVDCYSNQTKKWHGLSTYWMGFCTAQVLKKSMRFRMCWYLLQLQLFDIII